MLLSLLTRQNIPKYNYMDPPCHDNDIYSQSPKNGISLGLWV